MEEETARKKQRQSMENGPASAIIRIKTNEACRELQKDQGGAEYV